MSIVKLKNGKQKFINDKIDLQNVIFDELGSDAEDEYIKIIENTESLKKEIEFLINENKALKEENDQLEYDNKELENEINDLKETLNCVKDTIKSLQEEYKNNENENRKILNVMKSLERNIEI